MMLWWCIKKVFTDLPSAILILFAQVQLKGLTEDATLQGARCATTTAHTVVPVGGRGAGSPV